MSTAFREAILNPSTLDRLSHTILACWITGAFLVVAVSAWYLLQRPPRGIRHGDRFASVLPSAPWRRVLQLVAADSTARGVSENQPTKLAALEGLATTQAEAPLGIAGWVSWERDAEGQIIGVDTTALRIPGLLSLLVSGDFLDPVEGSKTVVKGLADLPSDEFLLARHPEASAEELKTIRPSYWPNVPVVFQTYHLMIALGMSLIGISLLGCLLWATGRLWQTESKPIRAYLWLAVLTIFMAQLATQAGWFTAEMGRQPWVVYGVLKTSEAASTAVKAPQVLVSIILFTLIYLMLTVLFLYLLARRIDEGPDGDEMDEDLPERWQALPLKTRRHTRA